MAIRKILTYPEYNDKLRRVSKSVGRIDKTILDIIQDLKDTLEDYGGAGLAAPQIGFYHRIAIVCFGQDEGEVQEPLVIINPTIVEEGPWATGFDGCLSIPDIFTFDTLRPFWLIFEAKDEKGRKMRKKVEGIDARLVHHEIDHLDGKLFIDRLNIDATLYKSVVIDNIKKTISFSFKNMR